MSVLLPQLHDASARLAAFDPKVSAKQAAEHFRDEVLEMQKRGELGTIHVEFGNDARPPTNRKLN